MVLNVPTAVSLTVSSTPMARGRLVMCQAVSHTHIGNTGTRLHKRQEPAQL